MDDTDELPVLPEEKGKHEVIVPYQNVTLSHDSLFSFNSNTTSPSKTFHHSSRSCHITSNTSQNDLLDIPGVTDLFKLPLTELKTLLKNLTKNRPRHESEADSLSSGFGEAVKKTKAAIVSLALKITGGGFNALRRQRVYLRNYIGHALNQREIYMQYVAVTKDSTLSINAKTAIKQLQTILASGPSYLKNCVSHLGRKTLVLDLDETLVHSENSYVPNSDFTFAYTDSQHNKYVICLNLRPYLKEFLEEVAKKYELIVYTATNPLYADRIINYIEHSKKYFAYRLYKQHCIRTPERKVYKCLDLLCSNRSIKEIIMVDNCVHSFVMNVKNGVPIKGFYGDKNDRELLHLANYLDELSHEEDVRERILKDFALYLSKHSHAN